MNISSEGVVVRVSQNEMEPSFPPKGATPEDATSIFEAEHIGKESRNSGQAHHGKAVSTSAPEMEAEKHMAP